MSIKIVYLDGPYDGSIVEPELMPGITPGIILRDMVHEGWSWRIDYSNASEEDINIWTNADIMARIYRAIRNGREVDFLGIKFARDIRVIRRAIVSSGYLVRVVQDDETGLVIDINQPQ